mmetsp:Transcript_37547/g.76596  ORF Transcript_37547/g.76596 Transcript_37547/m.76596 type:complete len:225 (-) Transcript_37547:185-859(-)
MSEDIGFLISTKSIIGIVAAFGVILVSLWMISHLVRSCQISDEENEKKEEEKRAKRRRKLVNKSLITATVELLNQPTDQKSDEIVSPRNKKALAILFSIKKEKRMKRIGNTEHTARTISILQKGRESILSEEENHMECNICLGDYEQGQEVCRSRNGLCNHMFHKSCIFEWLLKHDECPCCRTNFIDIEVGSKKENSSGDAHAVSLENSEIHVNDTDLEDGLSG